MVEISHGDGIFWLQSEVNEERNGRLRGTLHGVSMPDFLLRDLLALVERDLRLKGCASAETFNYQVRKLLEKLGDISAEELSFINVENYKELRLQAGVAPKTINNELHYLRRGFRLAAKARLLEPKSIPAIDNLPCFNVREGFAEPEQVAKILLFLKRPYREFTEFAHLTGWRKGAVSTLSWPSVEWDSGLIRLRQRHSKNRRTWVFPLMGRVEEIIRLRQAERIEGCDLVFHLEGRPIRKFDYSWKIACARAGYPDLVFHDLRRSAVRNLRKAGVDQTVVMKLSGHLTADVFRRYNIVDETDLREAVRRLSVYLLERLRSLA